jgi:hypothetical protein
LIIPWNTVLLLILNPTPEHVPLTGYVDSQSVFCDVLLTARGPVSALNPIKATVLVVADRTAEFNFSYITVVFWNSLEYPYNITGSEYNIAKVLLHPTSAVNGWDGSIQIVYPASGNFDVSVFFFDAKMQAMRQLSFHSAIIIAPQESTFSYVTSITFLSLELVVIGLMILEFRTKEKGTATKPNQAETSYASKESLNRDVPLVAVVLAAIALSWVLSSLRSRPKRTEVDSNRTSSGAD